MDWADFGFWRVDHDSAVSWFSRNISCSLVRGSLQTQQARLSSVSFVFLLAYFGRVSIYYLLFVVNPTITMARWKVARSRIVFVIWWNHNMRVDKNSLCWRTPLFVAMKSAQVKARPTSIYTAFSMSSATLNELHPSPTVSEYSDKTANNEDNARYIDPHELNAYVSAILYLLRPSSC